MREFINITKALSDESRVRVLMALRDEELCVCQIIEMLGLAPSTVSKHMALLTQAALVDFRKEGKWHYYRLPGREASPLVRSALRWIQSTLAETPVIMDDLKRLPNIIKANAKVPCDRGKN